MLSRLFRRLWRWLPWSDDQDETTPIDTDEDPLEDALEQTSTDALDLADELGDPTADSFDRDYNIDSSTGAHVELEWTGESPLEDLEPAVERVKDAVDAAADQEGDDDEEEVSS